MKKKDLILSILLALLFSNGCKKDNSKHEIEIIEEYKYTLEDYVTKKFNVYELKVDIKPLLDSIIESVNSSYCFKNEQITYSFEIYADFQDIKICIPKYMFYDVWLYSADALFFYKGYQFMYFGNFFDKYFTKTDIVIERNCIKPIEISPEEICIDDTDLPISYWRYSCSSNSFKLTDFHNCGNSWIDTTYYKVERWNP